MTSPRGPADEILYWLRWKLWPLAVSLPGQLGFVLRGLGGRCGAGARLLLALRFARIHLAMDCAHEPLELLAIAEEIVELPDAIEGPVIECGCFLGGSTSKLSLAAALRGRRLIVCDSFEGLPEPGAADRSARKEDFREGQYAARLPAVRENVRRFGRPEVVELVPGWFRDTLDALPAPRVACAFLDVDLRSSIRDCLRGLWSRLEPGAAVFVHDVDRPGVVEPFLDEAFWADEIGAPRPVFVGASTGIGPLRRLLGYARKAPE